MIRVFTLFIACLLSIGSHAQVDEISVGSAYGQQTYYSLADGSTTSHDLTSWDIAFSIDGFALGIFVNEALASSMSSVLPEVELYATPYFDFATADTSGMQRVYNGDISWATGAFNEITDSDPLDFGWGFYDANTHAVNGIRVFIIKLRNGDIKKLFIESLIGNVYTIKYADLDGGNEVTRTINKLDFPGKTLAYYSIQNDEVLDLEPQQWDLLFTRYAAPLDAGNGVVLQYIVTGVLTNKGVKVAKAIGVDPDTVSHADYSDQYRDTASTIGHDWKFFDLNNFQWVVPSDRVYFLKNGQDETWKIQFIDFEGSSTGVTKLSKSLVDVSGVDDNLSTVQSLNIFPNPTSNVVNIDFDSPSNARTAQLTLKNSLGQIVFASTEEITSGSNRVSLPVSWSNGLYLVSIKIEGENGVISMPLIIGD